MKKKFDINIHNEVQKYTKKFKSELEVKAQLENLGIDNAESFYQKSFLSQYIYGDFNKYKNLFVNFEERVKIINSSGRRYSKPEFLEIENIDNLMKSFMPLINDIQNHLGKTSTPGQVINNALEVNYNYSNNPFRIPNNISRVLENAKKYDQSKFIADIDTETISGVDAYGRQNLMALQEFFVSVFDKESFENSDGTNILDANKKEIGSIIGLNSKNKKDAKVIEQLEEWINYYDTNNAFPNNRDAKVALDRLAILGNSNSTFDRNNGLIKVLSSPNTEQIKNEYSTKTLKNGLNLLKEMGIYQNTTNFVGEDVLGSENGIPAYVDEFYKMFETLNNTFTVGKNITNFDFNMLKIKSNQIFQDLSNSQKKYLSSIYGENFNLLSLNNGYLDQESVLRLANASAPLNEIYGFDVLKNIYSNNNRIGQQEGIGSSLYQHIYNQNQISAHTAKVDTVVSAAIQMERKKEFKGNTLYEELMNLINQRYKNHTNGINLNNNSFLDSYKQYDYKNGQVSYEQVTPIFLSKGNDNFVSNDFDFSFNSATKEMHFSNNKVLNPDGDVRQTIYGSGIKKNTPYKVRNYQIDPTDEMIEAMQKMDQNYIPGYPMYITELTPVIDKEILKEKPYLNKSLYRFSANHDAMESYISNNLMLAFGETNDGSFIPLPSIKETDYIEEELGSFKLSYDNRTGRKIIKKEKFDPEDMVTKSTKNIINDQNKDLVENPNFKSVVKYANATTYLKTLGTSENIGATTKKEQKELLQEIFSRNIAQAIATNTTLDLETQEKIKLSSGREVSLNINQAMNSLIGIAGNTPGSLEKVANSIEYYNSFENTLDSIMTNVLEVYGESNENIQSMAYQNHISTIRNNVIDLIKTDKSVRKKYNKYISNKRTHSENIDMFSKSIYAKDMNYFEFRLPENYFDYASSNNDFNNIFRVSLDERKQWNFVDKLIEMQIGESRTKKLSLEERDIIGKRELIRFIETTQDTKIHGNLINQLKSITGSDKLDDETTSKILQKSKDIYELKLNRLEGELLNAEGEGNEQLATKIKYQIKKLTPNNIYRELKKKEIERKKININNIDISVDDLAQIVTTNIESNRNKRINRSELKGSKLDASLIGILNDDDFYNLDAFDSDLILGFLEDINFKKNDEIISTSLEKSNKILKNIKMESIKTDSVRSQSSLNSKVSDVVNNFVLKNISKDGRFSYKNGSINVKEVSKFAAEHYGHEQDVFEIQLNKIIEESNKIVKQILSPITKYGGNILLQDNKIGIQLADEGLLDITSLIPRINFENGSLYGTLNNQNIMGGFALDINKLLSDPTKKPSIKSNLFRFTNELSRLNPSLDRANKKEESLMDVYKYILSKAGERYRANSQMSIANTMQESISSIYNIDLSDMKYGIPVIWENIIKESSNYDDTSKQILKNNIFSINKFGTTDSDYDQIFAKNAPQILRDLFGINEEITENSRDDYRLIPKINSHVRETAITEHKLSVGGQGYVAVEQFQNTKKPPIYQTKDSKRYYKDYIDNIINSSKQVDDSFELVKSYTHVGTRKEELLREADNFQTNTVEAMTLTIGDTDFKNQIVEYYNSLKANNQLTPESEKAFKILSGYNLHEQEKIINPRLGYALFDKTDTQFINAKSNLINPISDGSNTKILNKSLEVLPTVELIEYDGLEGNAKVKYSKDVMVKKGERILESLGYGKPTAPEVANHDGLFGFRYFKKGTDLEMSEDELNTFISTSGKKYNTVEEVIQTLNENFDKKFKVSSATFKGYNKGYLETEKGMMKVAMPGVGSINENVEKLFKTIGREDLLYQVVTNEYAEEIINNYYENNDLKTLTKIFNEDIGKLDQEFEEFINDITDASETKSGKKNNKKKVKKKVKEKIKKESKARNKIIRKEREKIESKKEEIKNKYEIEKEKIKILIKDNLKMIEEERYYIQDNIISNIEMFKGITVFSNDNIPKHMSMDIALKSIIRDAAVKKYENYKKNSTGDAYQEFLLKKSYKDVFDIIKNDKVFKDMIDVSAGDEGFQYRNGSIYLKNIDATRTRLEYDDVVNLAKKLDIYNEDGSIGIFFYDKDGNKIARKTTMAMTVASHKEHSGESSSQYRLKTIWEEIKDIDIRVNEYDNKKQAGLKDQDYKGAIRHLVDKKKELLLERENLLKRNKLAHIGIRERVPLEKESWTNLMLKDELRNTLSDVGGTDLFKKLFLDDNIYKINEENKVEYIGESNAKKVNSALLNYLDERQHYNEDLEYMGGSYSKMTSKYIDNIGPNDERKAVYQHYLNVSNNGEIDYSIGKVEQAYSYNQARLAKKWNTKDMNVSTTDYMREHNFEEININDLIIPTGTNSAPFIGTKNTPFNKSILLDVDGEKIAVPFSPIKIDGDKIIEDDQIKALQRLSRVQSEIKDIEDGIIKDKDGKAMEYNLERRADAIEQLKMAVSGTVKNSASEVNKVYLDNYSYDKTTTLKYSKGFSLSDGIGNHHLYNKAEFHGTKLNKMAEKDIFPNVETRSLNYFEEKGYFNDDFLRDIGMNKDEVIEYLETKGTRALTSRSPHIDKDSSAMSLLFLDRYLPKNTVGHFAEGDYAKNSDNDGDSQTSILIEKNKKDYGKYILKKEANLESSLEEDEFWKDIDRSIASKVVQNKVIRQQVIDGPNGTIEKDRRNAIWDISDIFGKTSSGDQNQHFFLNMDEIPSATEHRNFMRLNESVKNSTIERLGTENFDLLDENKLISEMETTINKNFSDIKDDAIQALNYSHSLVKKLQSDISNSNKAEIGFMDTPMYELDLFASAMGFNDEEALSIASITKAVRESPIGKKHLNEEGVSDVKMFNDIWKKITSGKSTVDDTNEFIKLIDKNAGEKILEQARTKNIIAGITPIDGSSVMSDDEAKTYIYDSIRKVGQILRDNPKGAETIKSIRMKTDWIAADTPTGKIFSEMTGLLAVNAEKLNDTTIDVSHMKKNITSKYTGNLVDATENIVQHGLQQGGAMGLGVAALGLAASVLVAGYVGGNPTTPDAPTEDEYSDYESLQDQDLSINKMPQGAGQGYVININAQSNKGKKHVQDAIQYAMRSTIPTDINIAMNIDDRRSNIDSRYVEELLTGVL